MTFFDMVHTQGTKNDAVVRANAPKCSTEGMAGHECGQSKRFELITEDFGLRISQRLNMVEGPMTLLQGRNEMIRVQTRI